jgi:predicted transcriptional regulator
LQALALRSDRSQSALIREAIDAFLQQQQPQGRLGRLRQARGLWAERIDLPGLVRSTRHWIAPWWLWSHD